MTNQKNYADVGSDLSTVGNYSSPFSNIISWEASDSIAKCQLFFQAVDWDNLFKPCKNLFSLLCLVSFSLVSLLG